MSLLINNVAKFGTFWILRHKILDSTQQRIGYIESIFLTLGVKFRVPVV